VHARAALELIDDPQQRAAAALQLAELLPATDPEGAIETIEPHAGRFRDREARLRARSVMLTAALLAPGRLPLARQLAAQIRPEAGTASPAARMAASLIGYLDALENCPVDEILPLLEAAVTAPLDDPTILGQLCLGMIALVAADSPAALRVSDAWSATADELGYAGFAAPALMCRAHALLALGRLPEAIAAAREGVEVCELYVGGAPVSWTAAALVEALIETGELDEAERVANRIASTRGPRWTLFLHGLLASRARLPMLRGDRAGSLERMLELGRLCEQAGIRNPALAPWRSRAALLLAGTAAGTERARTLAAEEVELARAFAAPGALARALTALAQTSQQDEAAAVALHAEAVDLLDNSPARLELAHASLAQGAALRQTGAAAAARGPLRRAAELAEECGAAPLAAHAHAELLATGARPRRAALSGPDALTTQERRIAEIAAQGATNQEIAARLHLTPRTVVTHLSHAYQKLGITSRSQLAHTLE
jgi:DNA-binding CsgD family transcriptional regulator